LSILLWAQFTGSSNVTEELAVVSSEELNVSSLELGDLRGLDVIEESLDTCVDDANLLFGSHWTLLD
jgi:hypothetical protein